MPVYDLEVYNFNPTGVFSTTAGATFIYTGGAPTGTATVTDSNTILTDDSAGGSYTETASANVTIGGNTSIGSDVDAELVWTVTDLTTGETFQVIQLDVESGNASGYYTVSEQPLIDGHEYQIVSYNSNPGSSSGTAPSFSYADYVSYPDGIVSGTDGDDTIDTNYTGDPQGEMVDGTITHESTLSWDDLAADNTSIEGGMSTVINGVQVDIGYTETNTNNTATISNEIIYTENGDFSDNSSLRLWGSGATGDTSSLTLDFSSTQNDVLGEVENVTFRISDLDVYAFVDTVTITSVDAEGNTVTLTITPEGEVSVSGNTATGTVDANFVNPDDASGAILVTIPGPVSSITIDYGNNGTQQQAIHISDVNFDVIQTEYDDTIESGAGDDTIDAGLGDDVVFGGTGNDVIDGGVGNDTMYGEEGDDTFIGGEGADFMDGGSGQDTIDYSDSSEGVNVDLSTGTYSGGDAEGDSGSGIDGLIGSDYDDTFIGFDGESTDGANAYTNIFHGGAGNDYLDGAGGNDELYGDDGNDEIHGGTGDDYIEGGTGADTIFGGAGNDTIFYGSGNAETGEGDTVYGGDGDDLIDDVDLANSNDFNDYLDGGAGNDTIYAGAGDDTILGGDGNDVIYGEDGDDTISGDAGADFIDGGAGNDTIYAGGGDTIIGGAGNDTIIIDPSLLDGNAITIIGSEDAGDGDTDVLDLSGLDNDWTTNPIIYDENDPESGSLTLADGTVITFSNIEVVYPDTVICFGKGTRIATPSGARAVEDLKPGDLVLTMDNGVQPLRWVGAREVPAVGRFAPIEIKAGALNNDRDLIVSPQHRMLLNTWRSQMLFDTSEVFAAAKHLVNGTTIREARGGMVTYYHLMFDRHEVIFAEGAPSESFHVSDFSLTGVANGAREELFSLFPELRSMPTHHGDTARKCLKAHEVGLLIPNLAA
ncbi:Hint domain-containing protein [Celeribacter sp. PS-C1]|uniref:Hint domain-containing protein n=1 Tax=Celeribacter sp. PS-C1 TaxID=2820813 RepID=UPI001CA49AA3|nr:Hint domain-containing protein [Celeribacter sp. PS-C1]MBW6416868.1 Hint domain-containing protein [Celeribacter sp. PS-C1]